MDLLRTLTQLSGLEVESDMDIPIPDLAFITADRVASSNLNNRETLDDRLRSPSVSRLLQNREATASPKTS